jgi:hypothetical protein
MVEAVRRVEMVKRGRDGDVEWHPKDGGPQVVDTRMETG